MISRPYQFLFFDLDNTVWDFSANSSYALAELYDELHLGRFFNDFDQYHRLYKLHNDDLWSLYGSGRISKQQLNVDRFRYPLKEVGIEDEALIRHIVDYQVDNYFVHLARQTVLVDGALELLETLRDRGYHMSVISNGFSEVQHVKLCTSGLGQFFSKVYLSEDIGMHKPARGFFEYAIKSSNAVKARSLVIGDNFEADIAGARAFGIDQVFFNRYEPLQTPFEPTFTVTKLLEIKNICV